MRKYRPLVTAVLPAVTHSQGLCASEWLEFTAVNASVCGKKHGDHSVSTDHREKGSHGSCPQTQAPLPL